MWLYLLGFILFFSCGDVFNLGTEVADKVLIIFQIVIIQCSGLEFCNNVEESKLILANPSTCIQCQCWCPVPSHYFMEHIVKLLKIIKRSGKASHIS